LLAQGAVVLKPVYVRNEATTSTSLTQGKQLQNVPKYEVAIAVAPDDVIPLQSALNKSLKITCIAHSMQSDEGDVARAVVAAVADQQSVPVTVRAILAYDVVSRDAFVSPATRKMRMEPVSQQEIDRQGIITSLGEALGAVARHDIPAGRYLRRSDLLSGSVKQRRGQDFSNQPVDETVGNSREASFRFTSNGARLAARQQPTSGPTSVGDRPAITRFVPAGYTAIAIPWNRLFGAEHLQIGDELDLLASYSLERQIDEEETETRPDGTIIVRKRNDDWTRKTLRTWDESLGMRGEPWFVASGAIIVGPVGFPAPAAAVRALGETVDRSTSGGERAGLSGPPLLVAVSNRDVETVAAALATQGAVFTAAFHPSADDGSEEIGTRRIAIAAQDIDAFEALSDNVWHGNRRRPLSCIVAADDPRFADALTVKEMAEFDFRVLRRAKRRGEFFSTKDFLPEGSEPGVAAAASPGETVFAVADREIEGLDAFQANDYVAILVRGVIEAPSDVIAHGMILERSVSGVIVPSARILRGSKGGQTILAVANEDLTRLQAAWASSLSGDDVERDDRSHLLAVALPRQPSPPLAERVADHQEPHSAHNESPQNLVSDSAGVTPAAEPTNESIPSFDSAGNLRLLEAIVGKRREWHAFPAANATDQAAEGNPSFNFARH
jgi:hypothetical protein